MLRGGCSSLSLLAGTSVSPADPFVCHPRRAALGLPSTGQGAVLSPPCAPLPVPLPACPPCPCTSFPTAIPSSVGRHDAVLPAQKQKPPEGGRGHPGSSGAAVPCPALAPGTAPAPPRLPLPLALSLPFIFYVTYVRSALFLAHPGRRHMSLFRVIHFAAFASNPRFPATGAIPS